METREMSVLEYKLNQRLFWPHKAYIYIYLEHLSTNKSNDCTKAAATDVAKGH